MWRCGNIACHMWPAVKTYEMDLKGKILIITSFVRAFFFYFSSNWNRPISKQSCFIEIHAFTSAEPISYWLSMVNNGGKKWHVKRMQLKEEEKIKWLVAGWSEENSFVFSFSSTSFDQLFADFISSSSLFFFLYFISSTSQSTLYVRSKEYSYLFCTSFFSKLTLFYDERLSRFLSTFV